MDESTKRVVSKLRGNEGVTHARFAGRDGGVAGKYTNLNRILGDSRQGGGRVGARARERVASSVVYHGCFDGDTYDEPGLVPRFRARRAYLAHFPVMAAAVAYFKYDGLNSCVICMGGKRKAS